jgi:5'-methylthioadenosine phosphorylase
MVAEIGIIAGSGIYDPKMLEDVKKINIDTPFGKTSDSIAVGLVADKRVAFIPRHGHGHNISPSEVNSRANIFALKKLGVSRIIAVSAVGSLREGIKLLDLVIPDQIFDRTRRINTFFTNGIVAHVSFADPFCTQLSNLLAECATRKGYTVHPRGTYVCIEGPQFSTRAESFAHRKLGFDIIGMTALPEAKLAREAEICYSMIANVADYDVWSDVEVNVETVISNMRFGEKAVREIIMDVIPRIPSGRCECQSALEGTIASKKETIPDETRKRLDLLIGKYV